jgi:hypothetical protein
MGVVMVRAALLSWGNLTGFFQFPLVRFLSFPVTSSIWFLSRPAQSKRKLNFRGLKPQVLPSAAIPTPLVFTEPWRVLNLPQGASLLSGVLTVSVEYINHSQCGEGVVRPSKRGALDTMQRVKVCSDSGVSGASYGCHGEETKLGLVAGSRATTWGRRVSSVLAFFFFFFFFSFVVLGLELRVFTLRHSTCPIFLKGFLR